MSYPFLWNVPQLDRVRWTGFNPNHINVVEIDNRKFDVGALARNAGEAVRYSPTSGAPARSSRRCIGYRRASTSTT